MYRLKRQDYLLGWSAAWLLVTLHFVTGALSAWIGSDPWERRLLELSEFTIALAALAFYSAARLYAGLRIPVRTLIVATLAFAAWPVVHLNQIFNIPPTVLAVGLIHLVVGYTFLQEGRKQEARADVLLAVAFAGC